MSGFVLCFLLQVMHPETDKHFEAFDGAQYIMRPWLKAIYPHDWLNFPLTHIAHFCSSKTNPLFQLAVAWPSKKCSVDVTVTLKSWRHLNFLNSDQDLKIWTALQMKSSLFRQPENRHHTVSGSALWQRRDPCGVQLLEKINCWLWASRWLQKNLQLCNCHGFWHFEDPVSKCWTGPIF